MDLTSIKLAFVCGTMELHVLKQTNNFHIYILHSMKSADVELQQGRDNIHGQSWLDDAGHKQAFFVLQEQLQRLLSLRCE